MNVRREAGREASPNTRRQCARFGCTAIATATFTFDSTTCTVWIDPIDSSERTGGLSAGELCSRHARSLRPPRGWELEDRRPIPELAPAATTTSAPTNSAPASSTPAPQLAAGPPGTQFDNELRVLLNAQSPLLARAFRSSGTV